MKAQNKRFRLPLFRKFAVISTIIVVIFGSINIYLLWTSVYRSFEKEIDKRCEVLATIISEKVLTPMIYGDNLSIYNILDEIKQSDPGISYIFILNNTNDIIAQTYEINIPPKLLNINSLDSGHFNIEVIRAENFKYPVIRDIAYPILNGEIGTVRLGIAEEHIQQEMAEATENMLLMIIAFLIIGLGGAFFFSYIITSPIKKISKKAQIIDLNYIDSKDYNIKRRKIVKLFNFQFYDELDVLVEQYSEMLKRLKNSYIELQKTQGDLVQVEKLASLGTLSAGVAHEINNPISGIQNCINRIIKNPKNIDQNAKYIILIKEATNKIENVVQHLLNFSKKQDIIFEKVNLNLVIESSILLTGHKLQSEKIVVKADLYEKYFVKGSTNHLEQVFVNLILNSLDAIIERKENEHDLSGIIEINMNRVSDKIYIHLKDNGAGIPEGIQDKIFDPFFTSKKVGKGTGLGLSLSFNLIRDHKGKIFFNSSKESGTEFVIELPCFTEK